MNFLGLIDITNELETDLTFCSRRFVLLSDDTSSHSVCLTTVGERHGCAIKILLRL